MDGKSRTKNSIVNSASAIFSRGISTLMQFVLRTVFIYCLAKEYLGINGLFTNILTVLSLTELGIGDAIIYSMYKPLSQNDNKKLYSLMKLYAKAYRFIALAVAVIGTALIPFLDYLVEKPKDPFIVKHFVLIYLLFIFNTVVSYLFAYKRSILVADQKLYMVNNYTVIGNVLKSTCQIIAIVFQQYLLYLILQIVFTFLTNVAISRKANKVYPFINDDETYKNEKLDSEEKKTIFDNIKALIFYKIGTVSLDFSDNIIISALFGLNSVANLDGYVLITNSVHTILFQIANSLSASIGNLVATENDDKQYSVFKIVNLVNVLLYGFCGICIFVLINPFITIWSGDGWTFSIYISAIIAINFFILGSMNAIWSYRSTMGLFVHGRFRPLVSAIINIVVSISLGKILLNYGGIEWGVAGVLLGTTITRVTTNVWFDPYIVFKHGFKRSPLPYYLTYLKNFAILIISAWLTYFISNLITVDGIFGFIIKTIVTVFFSILFLTFFYYKTEEFKYIKNQLLLILKRRKKA